MIKSRITESAPNYEEFPLKIIAGVAYGRKRSPLQSNENPDAKCDTKFKLI
jgi:hypothetical protein